MDTNNNTLGGGEILDYLGNNSDNKLKYMDNSLINQFSAIPYISIIIYILLIAIMVYIILRMYKIKNPLYGRGISNEIKHMKAVRKRDASILFANNLILSITNIVEHSPFTISSVNKEYLDYNLERADIRTPGGARVLKAEEFNALVKALQLLNIIIAILLTLICNYELGIMLVLITVIIGNTIPIMYIRNIVKLKDIEINENFANFYLMIHYELIARSNTPLANTMKSYDKTTTSKEMHKFIDVCIVNIETYGDYEATVHISKRYKEIPDVIKLMRLIRQSHEGADVVQELIGFRKEILNEKEYSLSKRREKIIAKAKASFNILFPVLVQVILSALMIYYKDLSLANSFMK